MNSTSARQSTSVHEALFAHTYNVTPTPRLHHFFAWSTGPYRATVQRLGIGPSYGPFTIPSPTQPQKAKDIPPLRPCLTILLGLMLLLMLAGCGPASSDNAPNLGPNTSVGGSASRGIGQEGNTSITPISSGNETGSTSGKGTFPGGDNIGQGDKLAKSAGTPNVETNERDKLPLPGIPESIAKDPVTMAQHHRTGSSGVSITPFQPRKKASEPEFRERSSARHS